MGRKREDPQRDRRDPGQQPAAGADTQEPQDNRRKRAGAEQEQPPAKALDLRVTTLHQENDESGGH